MDFYPHGPSDFTAKVNRQKLPMVYVISTSQFEYIKIGKTNSFKQRFANIKNGCPLELHLWLAIRTSKPDEVEKALHQKFWDAQARPNSEWFYLSVNQLDDLVKFVDLTNKSIKGAIDALL